MYGHIIYIHIIFLICYQYFSVMKLIQLINGSAKEQNRKIKITMALGRITCWLFSAGTFPCSLYTPEHSASLEFPSWGPDASLTSPDLLAW